jgi:multisubunit Na+/H+ antiporter MnhG subunit
MKLNYKKTLLGSIIALIIGTSCCWLSTLAFWIGGASILSIIASFTSPYQKYILAIASILFLIGIFQFIKFRFFKR